MNDLWKTYQFLAAGLRDDPLLCLAQAVARFDPFWNGLSDDEFNDDGSLAAALDVTRDAFPDIYALAVDALHHGAEYDDLDSLICAEISARGIPLDCIESMGFGIPLPAYGTQLDDPDFYGQHPDVVPAAKLFGIQPADDYPIDIPDHAYAAMQQLMVSLVDHPDPRYQQVGWLVGWLGSATGNSSIDLDYSTMGDYEPLPWEQDHLEFAMAIIDEADEIMESVQAGLALLQSNPRIQQALQENIQRTYKTVANPKGKYDKPKVKLNWPSLSDVEEGT